MRVGNGSGTTGLSWLLGDHLGSTSITANSSGNRTAELRYKGWGESRYSYGTTGTTYRYTGQRQESSLGDSEGLYYYNARWYDPKLSRFAQADTVTPGGVQGMDRYAYVNNSPTINTDPTGNEPKGPGYCYETTDPGCTPVTPPTETPTPPLPPTETECDPCMSSWEEPSWWDTNPQNPDYYTLGFYPGVPGNPIGGAFTLAIDRYGQVYFSAGVNIGKSLTNPTGSVTGSFIGSAVDDDIPDQGNMPSFLTGLGVDVSGGILGGGGVYWSPGAGPYIKHVAWEAGGIIPGSAGVSVTYGWKIFDFGTLFGK